MKDAPSAVGGRRRDVRDMLRLCLLFPDFRVLTVSVTDGAREDGAGETGRWERWAPDLGEAGARGLCNPTGTLGKGVNLDWSDPGRNFEDALDGTSFGVSFGASSGA